MDKNKEEHMDNKNDEIVMRWEKDTKIKQTSKLQQTSKETQSRHIHGQVTPQENEQYNTCTSTLNSAVLKGYQSCSWIELDLYFTIATTPVSPKTIHAHISAPTNTKLN